MRAWILLVFAASVACAGKEEVGGTPVGSCTLGASQFGPGGDLWSCGSSVVDAGGTFQQCPANVGAGASCVVGNSSVNDFNPQPGLAGDNGFQNVFASELGPCFQCTSNGLGVVWNCTSQVWEAGDVFSCGQ
jgi:hypothetical protein